MDEESSVVFDRCDIAEDFEEPECVNCECFEKCPRCCLRIHGAYISPLLLFGTCGLPVIFGMAAICWLISTSNLSKGAELGIVFAVGFVVSPLLRMIEAMIQECWEEAARNVCRREGYYDIKEVASWEPVNDHGDRMYRPPPPCWKRAIITLPILMITAVFVSLVYVLLIKASHGR
mmetsp:Transcript_7518/g.12279  ORF Transcript_7518/g.12279 Transcript_7518/m.12279 type:complete len:176 (-) Transcript_7518:298-825(-)